MGIRSDVGFAIKRDPYTSLTVEQRGKIAQLLADAHETVEHDEGFLFLWDDVKWYAEFQEIKDLEEILSTLQPDDFILVCATPEYPEDNSSDRGDWYDNPWNLHKYVECRLEYC